MKNENQLVFFFFVLVVSMGGMLIHINYIIETNEIIHLVCTMLWLVICVCSLLILKKLENEKSN